MHQNDGELKASIFSSNAHIIGRFTFSIMKNNIFVIIDNLLHFICNIISCHICFDVLSVAQTIFPTTFQVV